MQNRLLALAAAFFVAVASSRTSAVAQAPPTTSSGQANIARENQLLQVFKTGEAEQLDKLLAPGFVNHAGPGDLTGPAATKGLVQAFHARFHPVKMEVKKQWADADHVSTWIRYTGANPAAIVDGIELTRYANGQAVEYWFFPNSQAIKP
jgi:hypothetical protein